MFQQRRCLFSQTRIFKVLMSSPLSLSSSSASSSFPFSFTTLTGMIGTTITKSRCCSSRRTTISSGNKSSCCNNNNINIRNRLYTSTSVSSTNHVTTTTTTNQPPPQPPTTASQLHEKPSAVMMNDYANISPPKYPLLTSSLLNSSQLSSSVSSNTSTSSSSSSVYNNLLHLLKKNLHIQYQQNIILTSETLFQAALQQSNLPEWFGPGRIGRDFRSRHAILTFHIWLLHKRLLLQESLYNNNNNKENNMNSTSSNAMNKDELICKDIDNELFNILWDNTTCRIRNLNVYELSVNKHLQNVQQYTFIHLVQYDHVYSTLLQKEIQQRENGDNNDTNAKHERLYYLRNIVAQHWLRPKIIDQRNKLYDQGLLTPPSSTDNNTTNNNEFMPIPPNDDIEDIYRLTIDHIDRIVHYMDVQYYNIMYDLPLHHFVNGHIRWINLPQFANLHESTTVKSLDSNNNNNNDMNDTNNNNTIDSETRNSFIQEIHKIQFHEYDNEPISNHPDDIIPYPWITNITNQGKIYYWNPITRISSWEKPKININ